ncbi:SPFH domain-containing protein, partial [uncultured Sphingomonas sp.]
MGLGIALLAAVIVLLSTFTIVDEKRQAVILRFEQPVRTVNAWQPNRDFGNTGAGVIARIPFVDRIVWVDKRVLDVDLENQPVLSTDQLRLQVDAYARFRVVDPL